MADDYTDNTGTTGTVAVGGTVTGDIETSPDRDWFAVQLVAGKTYQFDLEGSATAAGTLRDPYLRGIYDSNGNRIANTADDDSGTSWNSRVTFAPTESGTYYVAASSFGNVTGTCALSVRDADDDFLASTRTAGTVTSGGSVTGEIESAGDEDWFAVELAAGTTYRFDLEGSASGDGTLADPYLRGIHDSTGKLIGGTANDDGGTGLNSRVSITPTESGTYYVSAKANGLGTGTYRLSVTADDDYPDHASTTGTVAVGGSATGEIDYPDDRDWFAVELEAGRVYRFDLEGSASGGDDALSDPYLRGIHASNGAVIAGTSDDDGGAGKNSQVTFAPTASGTHHVSAGAHGDATGAYKLSVTLADDCTANIHTAGAVTAGGSATGRIDRPGDRDWFAVDLEAGHTYRFDLEGQPTEAGTLADPYLSGIHDSNGDFIEGTGNNNGGTGKNARVEFTPTESGTYYASAYAYQEFVGTYKLSVTDLTKDDFTADTSTTGTVAVGGSATGRINSAGDKDWFAVELVAGTTYRFDLEGSPSGDGTLADPYLRGIHDSNGDRIAHTTNDDGGTGFNSRVSITASESGTHYVSAGANGNGTGTYRLSVTADDDYPDHASTTGTVAVGGSATGEIDYVDDRDWFAVELEAGRVYRFDLEGYSSGDDALSDPYLRGIHASNGAVIAGTVDDDGGAGKNSQVTFAPTANGTYHVSAGAHGNATGAYKLSVTLADDCTADTGTAGAVAVGGSATGRIDRPGDRDWFEVELEAGTTYRFDLEGQPTGDGTLTDPYLKGVYDSDGDFIEGTENNNGGTGKNARVEFTPTESGTYYVSAYAYQAYVGTYTLSVTATDDYTADTSTAGTVAVGGSATGEIESKGDQDWFAVDLEAGTTYRIDLKGIWWGGGSLHDPYLHGIHDSDGELIAGTTDDDSGWWYNSRVNFTPTESGTFYVSAGSVESLSWFGTPVDPTGTYTLSVEEVL